MVGGEVILPPPHPTIAPDTTGVYVVRWGYGGINLTTNNTEWDSKTSYVWYLMNGEVLYQRSQ